MAPILPSSVRVVVRGWLNCNQVVLRAPGANLLVDSGYCTHAGETVRKVSEALGGEALARLVNTHCHSDHMGGNAAIARRFGCRVTIPEGEVKHVVPWTPQSVWMEQFDQKAEPFEFHDTISAGESFAGGGLEWQAHAAPGHDMDALMFFDPRNRILVSGDALWENGMGFVWPEEGANPHIEAALEALATAERLAPAVVIPGHGEPFTGVADAIAVARSRLEAFARDPAKNARHVAKVMFVYALLDKGSMPVAEVPAYLERVACYRQLSERFLGLAPRPLADWMLGELLRAGVVAERDALLRPNLAA